jgi:hypothetical protein
MSIPVDLADLPRQRADSERGYLLTSADRKVKALSVRAEAEETLLIAARGRGSVADVDADPQVTLLFPPLHQPVA